MFTKKGIPTDTDVDALTKAFEHKQEGETITHDEIESITTVKRGSNRYSTVLCRWKRRLLLDRNVLLTSLPGKGYMLAKPSKRISYTTSQLDLATGRIAKSVKIAATTDAKQLTTEEQRARDHVVRSGATMLQYYELGRNELKCTAPEVKRIN